MDRNSQEPTTYCHSCGRHILTSNFLIHQGRCQRMSELRSSRVSQNSQQQIPKFEEKKQTISFQQPHRQPYSFSNMNIKQKLPSFQKSKPQSQIQERIPCPFCGYGQTLEELDTHPNKCEHREIECQFCRSKFPKSLMEDHMQICQKNPINIERNNRSRNRMRRQQEEFHSDQDEGIPMIFNQRNRNMYSPSPLMDIFNSPLFGGPLERQPNRGPTYQFFTFSPNGDRNILFRSNSANPSTFIQLIEMLTRRANPNQNPGLNQQELAKLPRVNYHKKNPESDLCTICYCEFEQKEEIIELSCKHIFHQQCIFEWLKRVSTCPVCKKKLKERPNNEEEFEEEFQENPTENRRPPNYSNSNQGNQGGGGLFDFFGLR